MASEREFIRPNGGKRLVGHHQDGQYEAADELGPLPSQDIRRVARTTVKRGAGDRGDQPRR